MAGLNRVFETLNETVTEGRVFLVCGYTNQIIYKLVEQMTVIQFNT